MRIGAVILKLRYDKTSFKNFIGGAAQLQLAIQNTLITDMAFVIPLLENASENNYSTDINQTITERFGIVVALKNDVSQSNIEGIIAFERLHDIRSEFFKSLLKWEIPDGESFITYRGGKLLDINPAYLWYQFEFEYISRLVGNELQTKQVENQTTKINEMAAEMAKEQAGLQSSGIYSNLDADQLTALIPEKDVPRTFEAIYMNLIQSPSADLPYTMSLPVKDGYPDVRLPNMANWIDMTQNPYAGAFARSFASGFDVYEED